MLKRNRDSKSGWTWLLATTWRRRELYQNLTSYANLCRNIFIRGITTRFSWVFARWNAKSKGQLRLDYYPMPEGGMSTAIGVSSC